MAGMFSQSCDSLLCNGGNVELVASSAGLLLLLHDVSDSNEGNAALQSGLLLFFCSAPGSNLQFHEGNFEVNSAYAYQKELWEVDEHARLQPD